MILGNPIHTLTCFSGALLMFVKDMNMKIHYNKMFHLMKTSATFNQCVNSFLGCGGFAFGDRSLKDPFKSEPGKLYLVQVSSHFNGDNDNSHCIVIFNNKLYDINHTTPLPLTKDNLDLCCIGDDWKFHHVSRSVSFLPSKKMKKNLH